MRKDRLQGNTSLGYKECKESISIRIEAHKRYSNFSLEDWLEENLPFRKGDIVLDLGCGSGNFFPAYSSMLGDKGVIIGIDKSSELLAEASDKESDSSKILLECDMDHKLPFVAASFDHVVSTFAIYYADDPVCLLEDIWKVLKAGGRFCFIGPTDKNAAELYQFNKLVFGFDRDEKVDLRTNRLEKEFVSASASIFKNVTTDKIQRKLVFPDKGEFVKYYMATLLFEESVKRSGVKPLTEQLISIDFQSLEISKEMIVVWGRK